MTKKQRLNGDGTPHVCEFDADGRCQMHPFTREVTTSNGRVQGPLWTPTAAVERLFRQCGLSTADQITLDRKQLEGLLYDSLLWRQERAAQQIRPDETTTSPFPMLVKLVSDNSYHVLHEIPNGVAFKVVARNLKLEDMQQVEPKAPIASKLCPHGATEDEVCPTCLGAPSDNPDDEITPEKASGEFCADGERHRWSVPVRGAKCVRPGCNAVNGSGDV